MAIYSCNLASIGRSTHAPGTAGAHLRYVSREGAQAIVEAHIIPLNPVEARTWMEREEQTARVNARLVDKVRVAIPRELTGDERTQLVRDFVRDVTQDRVPWLFAIHQEGDDRHNPHAHIVLRDRDVKTGARILRLSDSARDRAKAGLEPKAVDWIRERWERHANAALARTGHDVRIDRRSLQAQGIEREPTIHIGVRGAQVEQHVHEPQSKKRRNALGREIDYPAIDQGRTRMERHAEIIDLNLERSARSPDRATRVRARFEREQNSFDRRLEKDLAALARRRTQEERALRRDFRKQAATLKSERRNEYNRAAQFQRESLRSSVRALRDRQRNERANIKQKQSSIWSRFHRAVDWTGNACRKHLEARRAQIADHKQQRRAFAANSREAWRALRESIAGRFAPREIELAEQRRLALAAMKEMHGRGEAQADAKRQLREQARERARCRVEEDIRLMKSLRREQTAPPTSTRGKDNERSKASFRAIHERASVVQYPTRSRRDGPEMGR